MANRLIIVFVVLVALTGKSFCDDDSLNSQNKESAKVPVSSSYGQSKDQEQNPAITDHQSSGYGQDNAAGDQDNKAKEGQSPRDSPHTEPASPSGSSDGGHAGEKDKAGSGGQDNTHRQDDSIHFPDDDSDEKNRWNLMNQYLRPPTSGYGLDQKQDQTDASGKKNVNDKDEGQDLGDSHHTEPTSSPSPGSSYSHDGGKDQAGSEGKDNKNDEDDKKKDQDSKVEDQKPGGAHQTEPASPSGSGYGQNSEKDQAVSGGEKSTNDQNDDKKDQGGNIKGQKKEDSALPNPVYLSTSRYGYDSESEQTDSGEKDSANDRNGGKNDQHDNAKDRDSENTHHTEPASPFGSEYGHDSGKDQAVSGGEKSTNDQNGDKKDQGDNAEGEKTEDFSYLFPFHPSGYGYDSELEQTDSWGKDQDDGKNDRDDNAQDPDLENTHGSGYGHDNKNDQGDNAEGEKTEDFSHLFRPYRPTLGYDYGSEKDQAVSEGENNTNDQDDDNNDQDELGSHYTHGPNHGQSHNTHHRYHPDSIYGHGSEQDHSGAGDEDNIYDQHNNRHHEDNNAGGEDEEGSDYTSGSNHDQSHNGEQDHSGDGDEDNIYDQHNNGHHKDNNAEGEDAEGSDYTSGSNHGQSHNGEQSQTDEDDNNTNEQSNAESQEGDRDGNQGSTGQGVDIGVSEQHVESLTKFGADNVLLIGERDNTIILESDGKNVTIGFNSIALAIAALNNVTLENYTSAKSSDVMLHRLANLLKNSDSKGYRHVIKSSHN